VGEELGVAKADDGLYRRVVEGLTDFAVIVTDADRRVVTWNAGAEKLLGYTAARMIGASADVIFTPEDVAAGVPAGEAATALATGRAADDRWHVRQDGTRFWASGVTTPLTGGGPRLLVKVLRDQTTLKAAQDERALSDEALRASELRFRRLLEANIIGGGISNRAGAWVEANDALLALLGHTREELRAGHVRWDRMTPPEYRPLDERAAAEAAERGACTPYEKEYVRADGTRVPVLIGYAQVSGVDDHYVCFVLDLTNQKRVERDLRASEERLRSVFDTMAEGFCLVEPVFDADGRPVDYRYLLVNPALERHTGLADIVGKTARELLPHHEQEWIDGYARVAVTGEPFRREGRVEDLDRWYEVSAVRVGDPQLRQVGVVFSDVTDRHRAEEALKDSERRFREIADTAPVALWLTDPAGRCTFLSREWYETTGQAETEALGLGWTEATHPDDRERTGRDFLAASSARTTFRSEYRLRTRDGAYRWVIDAGRPRFTAAGDFLGMVGVVFDIEDRKRAEGRLSESEERAAFVRRAGGVGFWYCDLPFDVLEWDDLVKAHFHLPPDARVTIDTFYQRIHPDDREPTRRAIERSISDHAAYDVHYRTVHPDTAAEKWVRAIGRTFYAADGTPTRFDGVTLDVTDQKRAEAAAAEAFRRLDSALIAGEVGTFEWEVSQDRLHGDANFARIFNISLDETGGAPLEQYVAAIHPDDRERVLGLVRRTVDTGVDYQAEYRIVSGDAPRWVVARGQAVREVPGGPVTRFPGVVLDITDRKRAEEAVREADRRKDEFLALLAHELRNPLAPLRNGLQVMRLAADDPAAVAKSRAMMDRQLAHLVRLVDDLLDVSRVSRGKMELRKERVLLADVVASAVETARPAIDAAGHEFHASLPAEPVYLDADLTRLSQVFSNLLTNAAKYTPAGGRIRLAAARRAGEVTVTVTDTGLGIPEEALPRIFDMFSQVDRSVERSTGGLGIGLALVKGLVEMHGGTVTAASGGSGAGSAFTVSLPLAAAQPVVAGGPPPADAARTGPVRRVLVVDDNRDSAVSMAAMLELLGHEVQTAHDGAEAVDAAEAFRPDIILMDVGMPKVNGYEATRRIRQRPWGAAVTVVALTGWGQDGDRVQSRTAGCDAHLVKPVHLGELEPILAGNLP
jgi:PAS domain S-box-containing protein